MLRHTENTEVIDGSQGGFMKGKLCLNKSGGLLQGVTVMVGEGRGTDIVTWACEKHLPLSCTTSLSLNWAEMGLIGRFGDFFAELLFLTMVTQGPALAPRKGQQNPRKTRSVLNLCSR